MPVNLEMVQFVDLRNCYAQTTFTFWTTFKLSAYLCCYYVNISYDQSKMSIHYSYLLGALLRLS
jgi:hypothetical protein